MMSGQSASYAEAAYFDGAPVAHCAAWAENARLRRIARQFRETACASRARTGRVL